MDSKINYTYIETYSDSFSDKIINGYQENSTFGGEDLLKLTEIKPINFLVLKTLFQSWKSEIGKLKSPYFDYDNPEVQESLKSLMNTLSRHILIERHNLKILLKNAVHQSLLLIFSPYDYYLHELQENGKLKTSFEELQEILKYIKVNRRLWEIFLQELEKRNLKKLTVEQAVEIFNAVLENTEEQPDDFMSLKAELDKVLVFDLGQMYSEKKQIENQPSSSIGEPVNLETRKEEPIYRPTLNDQFQKGEHSTLADLHAKQKITDIKKHISINQRFMFVNDLFGGSTAEFNQAVESLEKLDNYDTAMQFLIQNYQGKHQWDMDSEEVNEFIQILHKRYS